MKTTTVIAKTTKGHRIFLEGIGRVGQRYNVVYTDSRITLVFNPEGKRKVVARGVVDLEGKRVSTWKGLAPDEDIEYNQDTIVIRRRVA